MECELITMTYPTPNGESAQPEYAQAEYQQPEYQQQPYPPSQQPATRPGVGVLSILTLVLSLFLGFVSVVLGVFALRQNWKNGTRGSVMAWIGICIGAVVGVAWTWTFISAYMLMVANI